jgi:hypothetical protein
VTKLSAAISGIDLTKALSLSADLENQEILAKTGRT